MPKVQARECFSNRSNARRIAVSIIWVPQPQWANTGQKDKRRLRDVPNSPYICPSKNIASLRSRYERFHSNYRFPIKHLFLGKYPRGSRPTPLLRSHPHRSSLGRDVLQEGGKRRGDLRCNAFPKQRTTPLDDESWRNRCGLRCTLGDWQNT